MNIELDLLFERVLLDMRDMQKYHSLIAPLFDKQYREFTSSFERNTVHVFPDDVTGLVPAGHEEQYADHINDERAEDFNTEHRRLSFAFPNLHSSGMLALAMTILEDWLRSVCRYMECVRGVSPLLDHVNGSEFEKIQAFLKESVGLSTTDGEAWRQVREIHRVRHIFVHSNGVLVTQKDRKNFEGYRRRNTDFRRLGGVLQIQASFIPHVFQTVSEFIHQLRLDIDSYIAVA